MPVEKLIPPRSAKKIPPTSDFERLRQKCYDEGVRFEDPDFPAADSSLYYDKEPQYPVTWLRPHEILQYQGIEGEPMLVNKAGSRFDIKQKYVADCWVLAGAAAVVSIPDAFEWLVPQDQSFDPSWYAGIFRFRIWQYGEWVEVFVDDRLPTRDGQYMSVYSDSLNVFWGSLLEKAYAKIHGSYQALEGGSNIESLSDFTGGLAERYFLHEVTNLRKLLRKAFASDTVVGAAIGGFYRDLSNGLVVGHAYSVTGFSEVKKKILEKKTLLVRVRNPWGEKTEWKGAWSDSSLEWSTLTDESIEGLKLVKQEDGEFWMSVADFQWQFDCFTLCNFTPDSVEADTAKNWKVTEIHGKWEHGVSDGGALKDAESFKRSKQYLIKVEDHDKDDVASVIVQLMQKDGRKMKHLGKDNVSIAFTLLKRHADLPVPFTYESLDTCKYTKEEVLVAFEKSSGRDVTKRFELDPGEYVIVPVTVEPGIERGYLLRIFSEAPFESKEV